ncbi:MAG: nuclear transport factor 2 family protein [Alphaproteobacteria bacterium]|jgi:ketosteroid isomerase-like protein|nr:nuclear transport factor 2 family protein [Alphaproteobacteria bacterium]MBM3640961.1 nuclear transport factor 2 family protein [Alphaproteobacteria bacterium]
MADNCSFIRSLYAAFGRGDVKTILDNVDPSIEWISNGDANAIPWSGRRKGVAGTAYFFKSLSENLDFEIFEPRDFFDAGDTVIVIGRTRARLKSNGGVFDCAWAHVFTVKNGKLSRFREFYDTAAVVGAIAA